MESVAPVESSETEESEGAVSSVMQSVPPTPLFEDEEANKLDALQELKKGLPELEALSEDVRRCFAVVIENFHAANRLLRVTEKTGVLDLSLLEFRYAIHEIKDNVERLAAQARQVEVSTNEVVKGAQEMATRATAATEKV